MLYIVLQSVDFRQLIPRTRPLETTEQGLSEVPVVALLGTRQVGKTTLPRLVAADWVGPSKIFDLEELAARQAFSVILDRLLRQNEGLVVLDEVQRLPELFEVRHQVCDHPARKAVLLLLGSASWDLIKRDFGVIGREDPLRGWWRHFTVRGGRG